MSEMQKEPVDVVKSGRFEDTRELNAKLSALECENTGLIVEISNLKHEKYKTWKLQP